MISNNNKKALVVFIPGVKFPSISVTGTKCSQMCEHCKSLHLKGMTCISNGDELLKLAHSISNKKGTGFLLSGGCDTNGSIPIEKYASYLKNIPNDLFVNVHTGFITSQKAKNLANSGVSCFSVDVHQDEKEIRSILHLDRDPNDYSKLLDILKSTGVKVVPHLTVGFSYDDFILSADLVKSKGLKDVVLLSMVPTKGTIVEKSPSDNTIIDAVKILQKKKLNVTIGCMRDRTLRELEKKCIEMGVNKIANPSLETITWANKKGYKIERRKMCCCF